ncbi:MAG TPA: hypothetical protein VGL23_04465 [Chloroflexota bacterium]|jgi:hypothetical protein
MFKKLKFLLAGVLTTGLLVANIGVASAHQWCSGWPSGCFHWDKGGSMIVIQNFIYGSTTTQAEWARQDGWNKIGILYNYSVPYHTDVSVFDGNFGPTGWWGLASLESVDWDWGCFCYDHISHGHARFNTYYGGTTGYGGDIQGVYCQEIAHTWGLQHSDTGDCMGKGYFNNLNFYGPHNNADFYGMYRFH